MRSGRTLSHPRNRARFEFVGDDHIQPGHFRRSTHPEELWFLWRENDVVLLVVDEDHHVERLRVLLGIDELAYGVGHRYMTLVYQIDSGRRRLLGVVEGRTIRSMLRFFRGFGADRCAAVRVVCTDMWHPYLKVVAKKLPNALNILDRFHIAKKLGEAVDQVRRDEARRMHGEGYEPVLKNSRYCFLKRTRNLTARQGAKRSDLLQYNLRTVRAYLLKESFDAFWQYDHPRWARWFLRKWCARAMRSRLDPIKKFVRTLRRHEDLLMNYFLANKEYNSGVVEGLNLKWNLTVRKAFGFRTFNALQVATFHQLGRLPEPQFTHEFY